MRRLAVLALLLVLTACSTTDPATLAPEARLFTAMHAGDATVKATVFDVEDAAALGDLVRLECPGLSAPFSRIVLSAGNDSLVIYTAADRVACAVSKPAPARDVVYRPRDEAPAPEVAVTVNGEPITYQRIQEQLDRVPGLTEETVPVVVNALINAELLRQESALVTITDEDRERARLATEDEAMVDESARLDRLLRDRLLLDEVNVTEEAAKDAYLADPGRFLRSEQAVARLLYIGSDGRTVEGINAIVREVATRLPAEEFCALVREYSEDDRSREECGVYVLPRGVLDPDLEAAAFGTPQNRTAVVVTGAGVYFVQTIQVLPASIVPYPDVSGALRADLRDRVVQERLNRYVAILRSRADVVSYLG